MPQTIDDIRREQMRRQVEQERARRQQTPEEQLRALSGRIESVPMASGAAEGRGMEAVRGLGEVATGAGKRLLRTGANIGGVIERAASAGGLVGGPGYNPQITDETREAAQQLPAVTPQTPLEQFGFTAESIAEFFVPGGAVNRLAAGGKTTMTRLMRRVTGEATSAAAVTYAQTLDPRIATLNAATDAALTGSFGVIGAVAGRGARRAMNNSISPSRIDFADGYDVENIFRHNLQASSVGKMYENADAKIIDLSQDLAAAVSRHGDEQIDIMNLLIDAAGDVRQNLPKHVFTEQQLNRVSNILLEKVSELTETGSVGLVGAQTHKQTVGAMGAWAHNIDDVDMKAMEALANAYYRRLRTAVETGAPEVRQINRSLSEIIPLRNAMLRRIPAEQKARLFQLGDLIVMSGGAAALFGGAGLASTATGTAGLLLLSRGMHSPRGGRAMFSLERLLPKAGAAAGRTAAGTISSLSSGIEFERATAPE
jgi:hypothetical protein